MGSNRLLIYMCLKSFKLQCRVIGREVAGKERRPERYA